MDAIKRIMMRRKIPTIKHPAFLHDAMNVTKHRILIGIRQISITARFFRWSASTALWIVQPVTKTECTREHRATVTVATKPNTTKRTIRTTRLQASPQPVRIAIAQRILPGTREDSITRGSRLPRENTPVFLASNVIRTRAIFRYLPAQTVIQRAPPTDNIRE
jgi:hypothetical protein